MECPKHATTGTGEESHTQTSSDTLCMSVRVSRPKSAINLGSSRVEAMTASRSASSNTFLSSPYSYFISSISPPVQIRLVLSEVP